MISFLITFLLFGSILSERDENNFSYYITYSTAISLSYGSLGLLGIMFTFLKVTFLPLYLILTFVLLTLLFVNSFRRKIRYFVDGLWSEINLVLIDNLDKPIYILYSFLLILILILSIGPINHSDTANIYVGYPYQFLIKNTHFINGDLNQGLLGIGDFANIFYFQEKTSWLIRSSQFIPLFFVFLLMIKKNTCNILMLIFLSSPVLIQWLTIGKNNFLSESCIAIAFLAWEQNKKKKYLSYIFCTIFIALSFKISSIITSLPIVICLLIHYKSDLLKLKLNKIFKLISFPLVISILCLLIIMLYRYYLFRNPLYPLFSSFFNYGDQQLLDWELTLKSWDRTRFFPFWIFVPQTIGKVSFVLGPANLLFFLLSFLFLLKKSILKNIKILIGFSQVFLLMLFCQGRADYYISPLIIIYSGSNLVYFNNFNLDFISTFLNNIFKRILLIIIFVQFIMFFISSLYSLFINLYVLNDYDKGMNKTAYNFFNSNKIERIAEKPVYNQTLGMTNLFFNSSFITDHKFNKCFYYDKNIKGNKYEYCVNKLGIKTIIVNKNKLKNNKYFYCESDYLKRVSRNIFLEKRIEVDFCNYQKFE